MKTPSELFGVSNVSLQADETDLRTFLRTFLLASVLMITALVPFFVALNSASSQSEVIKAQVAPAATMLLWAAKDDAEKQTYIIDGYTLTLSTHIHGNGERVAFLRVRAPTGESASIHGRVGFSVPSAGFGVGKLDSQQSTHQVIFTSYTGGRHCCTNITVLELIEGTWRRIELGQWDGVALPEFPTDVDGDGTADFVLKDDRFGYAFAPYTESHKPPRIFNIAGGRVVEVGHEVRYDAVYEADMKRAHAGCRKHKNGACAAFVADATRLGRRAWAWSIMLAHYRHSTDWNFPTKCRAPPVANVCPPGQSEQFREFPDALAWFLTDTGYAER